MESVDKELVSLSSLNSQQKSLKKYRKFSTKMIFTIMIYINLKIVSKNM